MPGRSLEETLEVEAMKILGRARDQAGQIAGKHLGIENSAVIMARSGARGSMLNLSQMAGSIGQQAVRGERLSRGYWNRTLPHFKKGDLGAEAKGFVKSSYKSGLHPTEYFFHAMGGREGLVDTAVRTSRSGYMQRRLINALEDLKVKEDGTVRNTADTIIQFKFGEDGVDPSRSVQGRAVDIDDILQDVLGEEPSWKERLREQEMASYGLTGKDMYVEISEEEVEVEEEEPPSGEGRWPEGRRFRRCGPAESRRRPPRFWRTPASRWRSSRHRSPSASRSSSRRRRPRKSSRNSAPPPRRRSLLRSARRRPSPQPARRGPRRRPRRRSRKRPSQFP